MSAPAQVLTIDEVRLEAAWYGPPPEAAPTIVVLHEGLGCVSLLRSFPADLAAATGLGVFAYSRQGYGGSDPCALPRPLSYMHDEARVVLPRVLEAIGFRSGMLIGHSDGASIAAIYAGSTVDPRLNGLVLMAPHFFTEDIGLNSIRAMRETFRSTDLRARLARHHGHNVDCAFDGWSGAWLDPDFRAWDLRPFLPGIQVPTLIIQGRDDAYGTLAQVDTAVALIGARTVSVVLDHCGHAPQFEAKDATLTAIAEFAAAVGQKHGPA